MWNVQLVISIHWSPQRAQREQRRGRRGRRCRGETHHGGWLVQGVWPCLVPKSCEIQSPLRASNLNGRSCTVLSHRLPPLDACVCTQTTPNRKSRQEQDGELAVPFDAPQLCLNALSIYRVSISKSTTSRRATVPPPRARIPTCSCWSRCVLREHIRIYVTQTCHFQLYRFLARRTDSDFNKVISNCQSLTR